MENVEEKIMWDLCSRAGLKLGIVKHLVGAQRAVTQGHLPLRGTYKAVSSLKDLSLLFEKQTVLVMQRYTFEKR